MPNNIIVMQAPSGFTGTISCTQSTPPSSGQSYTPDAQGFITADPLDIFPLMRLGFTVVPGSEGKRNNLAATTDPGVGNDTSQDYAVGSEWLNITLGKSWMCLGASAGAAVWVQTGGAPLDLISTNALTALASSWNVLQKQTLSATGIVSGNGRAGRRELILSGTVTGGAFIFGGQDKLIVSGTMNHADSRLAAGFSQLDGSAGTFTAGQLSCHWFDWGATAPGGGWGDQANTARFQNTTGAAINSHLYVYGKAEYLADISANTSNMVSVAAGATPGGDLKKLRILVEGVEHFILAAATYS